MIETNITKEHAKLILDSRIGISEELQFALISAEVWNQVSADWKEGLGLEYENAILTVLNNILSLEAFQDFLLQNINQSTNQQQWQFNCIVNPLSETDIYSLVFENKGVLCERLSAAFPDLYYKKSFQKALTDIPNDAKDISMWVSIVCESRWTENWNTLGLKDINIELSIDLLFDDENDGAEISFQDEVWSIYNYVHFLKNWIELSEKTARWELIHCSTNILDLEFMDILLRDDEVLDKLERKNVDLYRALLVYIHEDQEYTLAAINNNAEWVELLRNISQERSRWKLSYMMRENVWASFQLNFADKKSQRILNAWRLNKTYALQKILDYLNQALEKTISLEDIWWGMGRRMYIGGEFSSENTCSLAIYIVDNENDIWGIYPSRLIINDIKAEQLFALMELIGDSRVAMDEFISLHDDLGSWED